MTDTDPRIAALWALTATAFKGAHLDDALESALPSCVAPRERALAKAIAYGTCRYWHRLSHIRDQLLNRGLRARDRELGVVLLMGLHQLFNLRIPAHAAVNESVELVRKAGAPWAAKLVNAVLRRAARDRTALEQAADSDVCARLSHPRWLLEALRENWPERWQAIAHANNEQPPMILRVNSLKSSRQEYLSKLASAGLAADGICGIPHAIRLQKPVDVSRLPGFEDGEVSVQDGAAQLAATLLPVHPGQRVLDACAAPGGKTAHLLELHPQLAEMVAVDSNPARVRRLQQGLLRLGLEQSAHCLAQDARCLGNRYPRGHFQAILLDAPCTASGVIRRHPDIKLLRRAVDVQAACALQRQLLDALWPLLAQGGTLLYATCSVMPAENDEMIDAFVAECQDAEPIAVALPFGCHRGPGHQILPGDAGMDGFFYALLAKC